MIGPFLPLDRSLEIPSSFRAPRRDMAFYPPDDKRPHDPLDGRDDTVRRAFGSASLVPKQQPRDIPPPDAWEPAYYSRRDDLQESPSPLQGIWKSYADSGVLTVMKDRLWPSVLGFLRLRTTKDGELVCKLED